MSDFIKRTRDGTVSDAQTRVAAMYSKLGSMQWDPALMAETAALLELVLL